MPGEALEALVIQTHGKQTLQKEGTRIFGRHFIKTI